MNWITETVKQPNTSYLHPYVGHKNELFHLCKSVQNDDIVPLHQPKKLTIRRWNVPRTGSYYKISHFLQRNEPHRRVLRKVLLLFFIECVLLSIPHGQSSAFYSIANNIAILSL